MAPRARGTAAALFVALLTTLVGGCGSTPVAPTRSAGSDDSVQEAVGIQELRRELADLRDNVEVQRNELNKLQERQRQLYDDLDYRLRKAEKATGTGQASNAASSQSETGDQQLAYGQSQQAYGQSGSGGQTQQQSSSGQGAQQTTGQMSDQTSGQSTGQTMNQGSQQGQQQVYGQQGVSQTNQGRNAGQQPPLQGQSGAQGQQSASLEPSQGASGQRPTQMAVASADEQAAYDDAFELLKQSRYADAIIAFRSLISKFPNGALIDDAQYWIGEAYYVTRDFDSALDAFKAVVSQYPDSQRVPDAMLKLGYVQAELGRTDEARQTLNQVISEYPGSRVAISAETRLNKIR